MKSKVPVTTSRRRKNSSTLRLLSAIAAGKALPAASKPPENVTVIGRFHVVAGREREAEQFLLRLREFVRRREPGITYRFHRSSMEPSVFVIYESYPSEVELAEHINVVIPAFACVGGPIPEGLFTRPYEAEILREILR